MVARQLLKKARPLLVSVNYGIYKWLCGKCYAKNENGKSIRLTAEEVWGKTDFENQAMQDLSS